MIPKSEKGLEAAYEHCIRGKTFIPIHKESFADYRDEALADLNSAKNEENPRWAIVKAYQSLFLQCTAILVKHLDVYSKDHGCLITALLKHNLINPETLEKIHTLLDHKKTLFEEIDHIRISRNKALYFPKAQNQLGKQQAEHIIEEIRQLLVILGEIL